MPDENAGSDKPTVVVYPHFASIGMHSDYVDWYRSNHSSDPVVSLKLTHRQC